MRLTGYLLPAFAMFAAVVPSVTAREMTRQEICALTTNEWPTQSNVETAIELANHNAHAQGMVDVVVRQNCEGADFYTYRALYILFSRGRELKAQGYDARQIHEKVIQEFYVRPGL